MESVSLAMLLDVLKNFGPLGLVAVMWWVDTSSIRKIIDENRRYNELILSNYKKDMDDMRRMYESNVRLVEGHAILARDYAALAKDLKEAYIMNSTAFQRLADDIEHNEFCPKVRLEKKAQGIVG